MASAVPSTTGSWSAATRLRRHCILGTDYYRTNEQLVHPDGQIHPAGEVFGY